MELDSALLEGGSGNGAVAPADGGTEAANGRRPLPHHRVAVIGSGFAGLGMAIRMKQAGIEDFVVLERADEVGGTWRDNSYPGCQCDVPSHLYSFSFMPNPNWSRTYSTQPEIEAYLRRCAEEGGVTSHLRFGCDVVSADWDEGWRVWRIETSRGPLTAEVLVAGSGPMSEPTVPAIPGLGSFEGTVFHSAEWDHGHDLRDRRVAVVGTGASAIQFVPQIQPEVSGLHLFQRTPPWILPHPDRPTSRFERLLYRLFPPAQKLARAAVYLSREPMVLGLVHNPRLLRLLERVAQRHLRRQVADPELRRRLRPHYRIGCKRILLSDDWYPALAQPNVELVTEAIRQVRPEGIETADGTLHEVDTIIFGTGFKVTDPSIAHRVRGRNGLLAEAWRERMEAYLGTAVAGFPNFFMLIGPNTGLGHNSMVFMIESQLNYVVDCIRTMDERGLGSVELRPEAQREFNADLQRRLEGTVWESGGCASWYLDSRGCNRTIWPRQTWSFRRLTRSFDLESYSVAPRPEGAPAAPGSLPASAAADAL